MAKQANSNKRTWLILASIFIVIIIGIIWYSVHSRFYPSTDDSYVQAHIVNIAPQVSGPVIAVKVKNHQMVQKGQPLIVIDPAPYQYALASAQAQLKLAQEKATRLFPLIKTGKVAPSEGDDLRAQIQEANANLNQAQYNLNHTIVVAPTSGILANFDVRAGDSVAQGVNLFALVEQSHFWVNANFKETQLKRIHPGQTATVEVDMYPGHKFKGVVQSISPGTGVIFSLLPPENATGNWVKVTQRIPVKISIEQTDKRFPLHAGSSAKTIVDTTTKSH